ncbi:UNVERIFIED_CONTAM: Cyp4v2 [Trichonephila clavipes]
MNKIAFKTAEMERNSPSVPLIKHFLFNYLGGYTLPKDSTCLILVNYLHKDKEVFPDPERFDPNRFLPENSIKIPKCGYIPFSAGLRSCLGQKFAMMEMKTIICSILRNYTIESLDSRDWVLPVTQFTLHPSIPIRIRLRSR